MLADGTYRARAIEGALGFTKGDKEQAAILLEVSEGEAEGQRITWFGYFTEKTTDRTMEALRLCGWLGDDISDLSSINGACDVTIVVEAEEYEGKWNAKVKWINRLGGGGIALNAPMAGDKAKSFAATMRAKAAASRIALAAKGEKVQRTEKAAGPPADSENPAPVDANGHPLPF